MTHTEIAINDATKKELLDRYFAADEKQHEAASDCEQITKQIREARGHLLFLETKLEMAERAATEADNLVDAIETEADQKGISL